MSAGSLGGCASHILVSRGISVYCCQALSLFMRDKYIPNMTPPVSSTPGGSCRKPLLSIPLTLQGRQRVLMRHAVLKELNTNSQRGKYFSTSELKAFLERTYIDFR